jgi:Alpha/beta hydrolase family
LIAQGRWSRAGGPVHLDRPAEVSRHPAGCVEAHGLIVLPQYGEFRFHRTLEAARRDIGNGPDLAAPVHAVRLRIWLNHWTCRIGYLEAGETDVFAISLADWWADAKSLLPGDDDRRPSCPTLSSRPSAAHRRRCTGARLPPAGPAGSALSGRSRPRNCSTSSAASQSPPGTRRSPPIRVKATTIQHSCGTSLPAGAGPAAWKPRPAAWGSSQAGSDRIHRPASSVAKLIDEVHALGEQAGKWELVTPRFAERYRVFAVDLRGHRHSDWPGTYSFQLMRDDVIALIHQLGLREVLLACHSMGGIVACLVAMTRPDQVARLIIEGAPPPFPRDHPIRERPAGPPGFEV